MKSIMIILIAAGCGGGGEKKPPVDAMPDVAPVTLECSTYCREIQEHCMGTNAQYPDMDHCMSTCALFTKDPSTVNDMSGNTLGCRIYHAGAPAMMAPEVHCPHAGPAGDLLSASPAQYCSEANVCATFCALEIKTCGSLDSPLDGDPRDATNNHLFQFQNMNDCVSACAAYDKTHVYSAAATGNSLACRLAQVTTAAISTENAKTSCRLTGDTPRAPCIGTPSP